MAPFATRMIMVLSLPPPPLPSPSLLPPSPPSFSSPISFLLSFPPAGWNSMVLSCSQLGTIMVWSWGWASLATELASSKTELSLQLSPGEHYQSKNLATGGEPLSVIKPGHWWWAIISHEAWPLVASNSGFPFWILLSPKLQYKIRNGILGFESSHLW